jgi:mRNA interferase MazF
VKEADVILTALAQSSTITKLRPALVLKIMPRHGDFLVCGISTQLNQAIPNFDEIITATDPDFQQSGLRADSVIRLGFLALVPQNRVKGSIGEIMVPRHSRLLRNLSAYLTENLP